MNRTWTLLDAHRSMTEFLGRHGVDQPRLASEIITAHALGINRIDIYTRHDLPLKDYELDSIRELGKRLAGGEALQLVVGDCQFFSLFFKVRKGVFIPRPETETLVEAAVRALKNRDPEQPPAILDLCTGTGVVAISLLQFIPGARGAAVDVSPLAVELATENAGNLGVSDRLDLYAGDLFEPLPAGSLFDAITANPPYIPTHDILRIEPVVKDNDPNAALDGGPEGQDVIKRIIEQAPEYLAPGGFLALEVGAGQAPATETLFSHGGFCGTGIHPDLSGIERVVMGWKSRKQ